MEYKSKYKGVEIDAALDKVNEIYEKVDIPIVIASSNVMALDPNIYYKFSGALSSVQISLNAGDADILNQYIFEFTTAAGGCTLMVPSDIKWKDNQVPIISANKTYQISIVNNCAICAEF